MQSAHDEQRSYLTDDSPAVSTETAEDFCFSLCDHLQVRHLSVVSSDCDEGSVFFFVSYFLPRRQRGLSTRQEAIVSLLSSIRTRATLPKRENSLVDRRLFKVQAVVPQIPGALALASPGWTKKPMFLGMSVHVPRLCKGKIHLNRKNWAGKRKKLGSSSSLRSLLT